MRGSCGRRGHSLLAYLQEFIARAPGENLVSPHRCASCLAASCNRAQSGTRTNSSQPGPGDYARLRVALSFPFAPLPAQTLLLEELALLGCCLVPSSVDPGTRDTRQRRRWRSFRPSQGAQTLYVPAVRFPLGADA